MKLGDYVDHAVILTYDKRQKEYEQSAVRPLWHELWERGLRSSDFLAGDGVLYPRYFYNHIDVDVAPRRQAYNYAVCLKAVLENAHQLGYQKLFYFEDDALLTPEFDELFPVVMEELATLPSWWDLFFVGGNHTNGFNNWVRPHIIQPTYSLDLHAVIFSRSGIAKLKDLAPSAHYTVDGVIGEKQRKGELTVYAAHPCLITQRKGYSYNENRHDDKTDRHWTADCLKEMAE